MKQILAAIESSELAKVNQFIGDTWFDVDEVIFDIEKQLVLIPLIDDYDNEKYLPGAKRSNILQIKSVKKMIIEDIVNIGKYDIHRIIYRPNVGQIDIETNIPLRFICIVDSLDISILV
jgi:hypothetical protein